MARAQQPERLPVFESAGSKSKVRGIRPVSCRPSGRACTLLAWSRGATTCLKSVTPMATKPGCPRLAAELLGAGVRIIVATSQPSIAAAARVTKTVPVIGRMDDDPVADGMARSLARPGGNITGIYAMTEELNPKRLALLKEVAPSVRRVGVLLRQDSVEMRNMTGRLR